MKNKILSLICILLILVLTLSGCGGSLANGDVLPENEGTKEPTQLVVSLDDIPEYSNSPYVAINDNQPSFTEDDYTTEAFEEYAELDSLGRCGVTYACVGVEIMPTEKRGDIGMVKPTGWVTAKYDFVDGKYLYNRCHLIGFQLTGENANTSNLITGTRYMNTQGMLPFENMIADYENPDRDTLLDAPRQYALGQTHKHLPEMQVFTGLANAPVFLPIVGDFYSGMEVTVPLFGSDVNGATPADILELYHKTYDGSPLVRVAISDESGFLSAGSMTGKDSMEISVYGNPDRMILVARYDNLGKGASGAAVECLNILLGADPTANLVV